MALWARAKSSSASRDVVADDRVVAAAERLGQQPLRGKRGDARPGEPVAAGDVHGQQIAAGGAGGDARAPADQRLPLGAAGERDDDPLAGLPGARRCRAARGSAASPRRRESASQSSASSRSAVRLPVRK